MIWSCIYPNALISKYDIIIINNLVREKKKKVIITTMTDLLKLQLRK